MNVQETFLLDHLINQYGPLLQRVLVRGSSVLIIAEGLPKPIQEESHQGWKLTAQSLEPTEAEWKNAKILYERPA
jgi:hypothetical protein